MQTLAETLKVGEPKPVDPGDTEYIEKCLSWLPTTAEIEAELKEATARRDAAPEGTPARRNAQRTLDYIPWKLERCAQRDAIAAGRPEGCWCLGIGGRQPRFTQFELKVFSEYCDCPDGQRVKKSQEAALVEERRLWQIERSNRLFENAQVPSRFAGFTIESYPVTDRTRAAFDAVALWQEGPSDDAGAPAVKEWAKARKKSLLLHGPYGVGKTGLAVSILRREIDVEGGGLFFTVPTLLDHIRRTYGPNPVADEHEIVQTVKTTPFLVLDDLGAERVTEWVREKLFTIINHRHDEDLPTVFTSNLDLAELGQHIGERTTWRLVEMCQVIHLDGPNLRVSKGA